MHDSARPHALKILGVFAHPDDEVFCAGGTFAKYAAAGAEIMVVSMTPGNAGQIRDARVATRRTLGMVRAQELRSACAHLGIQHVHCLEYGDGTLADMDQQVLVEHITRIIREFRPDVVITFGEDGAYGHPDHIAVSIATTKAFRGAENPAHCDAHQASGLQPHIPTRLYHSHFPRSRQLILDRLVTWLMDLDTRFHGSLDFAHGLMLFADESTMLGFAADHIKVGWYPAGFYMVEQGEPATSLFLILSGQADVLHEGADGSLTKLNTIGPGQFFGEQGLALIA